MFENWRLWTAAHVGNSVLKWEAFAKRKYDTEPRPFPQTSIPRDAFIKGSKKCTGAHLNTHTCVRAHTPLTKMLAEISIV